MNKHNIFISWSGDRSKLIADALYEWLPMVVQSVKPFMSSHSIDKGSRGALEMAKALDGTKVGISCLTPENLAEPWILYEAGCLSKTIDDSTRLCTYLLGGLKNQDIQPPLAQFQHTGPNEEETRSLVHTINKAVGGDDALSEKTLDAVFKQFWPVLEPKLRAFPAAPKPMTKRSMEDMLAEILQFTRSETNRRSSVFYYDADTIALHPAAVASGHVISSGPQGPAVLSSGPAFLTNSEGHMVFSGSQLGTLYGRVESPELSIIASPPGALEGSSDISGAAEPKAGAEKTVPGQAKKSR